MQTATMARTGGTTGFFNHSGGVVAVVVVAVGVRVGVPFAPCRCWLKAIVRVPRNSAGANEMLQSANTLPRRTMGAAAVAHRSGFPFAIRHATDSTVAANRVHSSQSA